MLRKPWACLAILAVVPAAQAAPARPPPVADSMMNYTVGAVRIDSSEAPVIDGDLSDAVWAKAAVLDDFRQVEPDTGQPASERTVLRILYDENNLYFGVYLPHPRLVPKRGSAFRSFSEPDRLATCPT
jgi:hypothetical protein